MMVQAKILGIATTGRVKVLVVPAANVDAQGHLVSHDADGIKAVQLRGDALTKLTIVSVETLTEAVDLAVLLARGGTPSPSPCFPSLVLVSRGAC